MKPLDTPWPRTTDRLPASDQGMQLLGRDDDIITHPQRSPVVLRVMFALYLVLLGALGGIVVERFRFDHQRGAVLSRYQQAIRLWQSELMNIEQQARSATTQSRAGHNSSPTGE